MPRTKEDVQKDLQKVIEELRDLPTSWSQSNPSYVLGKRSLERRYKRLLEELQTYFK